MSEEKLEENIVKAVEVLSDHSSRIKELFGYVSEYERRIKKYSNDELIVELLESEIYYIKQMIRDLGGEA